MWMSRDRKDVRSFESVVHFWDEKPSLSEQGYWFDSMTGARGSMPVCMTPNAPRRGQCVEIDGPPRVEVTVKRKPKKGAKAK